MIDMHFGFSYIGLLFLLMLMIPNIIWSKNKPEDYDKYVKNENRLLKLFESLLGIPVAGATLPVISFLLLGIYGRNIFLLVSTIILGIGHIGIHLNHRNEAR